MPITLDRSICCDLNETISREWLITNGLGGYASGTVAGTLTRMQHGLLVAPLQGEAMPRLLLAKIDEEVVFDQRTYYPGTNEYQDGTLNPAGFGHLETFRLEEGFPVFTYRLGGIDGITLEKRIWMPYGLNTTYIQYRVLRTDMPHMSQWVDQSARTINRSRRITGRPGTAKGAHAYGRGDYAATENRSLALTLLPYTAYRSYNTPQYGNLNWQFQVQTHQPEYGADEGDLERSTQGEDPQKAKGLKRATPRSAEALGTINRPLQLPQGVTGCTIRAWEGASPYSIFIVGHPESEATFIPTGVWYWHFLRRHEQAAGLAAIDDLYLPGVFRAKLWPGEESTLTIIVTAEELSSLTFNDSQITLSHTRAVEHARSFLQPERYFGDGGETAQTLPVLPFTTTTMHSQVDGEEFLRLLLQAGDRFVARRTLQRNRNARNESAFFSDTEAVPVIIPGYYDMQDRTRETLIALPGLTLATRRYADARSILRSLARHFKQGLLPDRLPTDGQPLTQEDYGNVDTSLWFFNALDHYLRLTQDYSLLDDLYSRLVECISEYMQGTNNGIHVDAHDGLLQAHQPGKALTWMNAMIDDEPVTPRYGKPVEVNALWYNALCLLDEWTQVLYQMGRLTHTTGVYAEQSALCKLSFNRRFWLPPIHVAGADVLDTSATRAEEAKHASLRSAEALGAINRPLQLQAGRNEDAFGGYLYDVIDGPDGDDTSFRPNQLLALSLRHAVLDEEYHSSVLELVTRRLVTPYGLRTLAPQEEGYQGQVKENTREQRQTLHQGSCWPWLIGPYVDALLRLEQSGASSTKSSQGYTWRRGLRILEPFRGLSGHGMLGMVREMYDGNATGDEAVHTVPCGEQETASAISIGELLRVYKLLAQTGMRHLDSVFSV